MANLTMDLNDFNKMVGVYWEQNDDYKWDLFTECTDVSDPSQTRCAVEDSPSIQYRATARASGKLPFFHRKCRLGDVKRALREIAADALVRKNALGITETVHMSFDKKEMVLRCCGKEWRVKAPSAQLN